MCIPNDFIKTIICSIAIPLTIFLSRCLEERPFPEDLKLSKNIAHNQLQQFIEKMGLLTVHNFVF